MHGGHENSMDQLSEQGNLLWGIDNCLGMAGFVVKVCWMALDNSFINNFSLFQLKFIKHVCKNNYEIRNNLFYKNNYL